MTKKKTSPKSADKVDKSAKKRETKTEQNAIHTNQAWERNEAVSTEPDESEKRGS